MIKKELVEDLKALLSPDFIDYTLEQVSESIVKLVKNGETNTKSLSNYLESLTIRITLHI